MRSVGPGTCQGIPQKRRREDDASDVGDYDAPTEITTDCQEYSEMTDISLEDDAPFQVVTYRKSRAAGIPVVFRTSDPNSSFWKVNPNCIARDIVKETQEKVLSHRITRDGNLVINVASEGSANSLLLLKTIAGIEVEALIPDSYLKVMGRITDIPTWYSAEQLLHYLRPCGVIAVKRDVVFSREEDGTSKSYDKRSVVLTFRPGHTLPADVCLGFTCHPVSEYVPPPTQCFHCQRFGHIARDCHGTERCKICAGPHDFKSCTARREPKCANCGGPHVATYRACRVAKAATEAHIRKVMFGKSKQKQAAPPNPDFVKAATQEAPPCFSRLPEDPPRADNQSVQGGQLYSTVVKATPCAPGRARARKGEHKLHSSAAPQAVTATVVTHLPEPCISHFPDPSITKSLPQRTAGGKVHPQKSAPPRNVLEIIVPLLFQALRAILQNSPTSANLPAVRAILAFEPLLTGHLLDSADVPGHHG